MGNTGPSVTPFKCRQRPICLDDSRYGLKSWTAASCHRLLRPIKSRVELLRKGNALLGQQSSRPNTMDNENAVLGDSESFGLVDSDDDMDWAPKMKKIRRTYGRRHKNKNIPSLGESKNLVGSSSSSQISGPKQSPWRPGQILIPTPILKRSHDNAHGEQPTSPCVYSLERIPLKYTRRRPQARYQTKDGDAHWKLAELLRRIRGTTPSATYNLYMGLFNSLETLLKATSDQVATQKKHRQGSRSLFQSCLKAVPRRIREVELLLSAGAEEQGSKSIEMPDVSSEIYSDLETYGSSVGWLHLRTVVRADGIEYVCAAISERLLDPEFVTALVMLCIHTASLDEAEAILEALLTSSRYPSPTGVESRFEGNDALLPLSALEDYVAYTARTAFHHRQLKQLFDLNLLPYSWLATSQLGSSLTSVFRTLASESSSGDALTLLSTVLPLMCQSHIDYERSDRYQIPKALRSVLDTTFESALTTLCAISLLESQVTGKAARPSCDNIRSLLRSTWIDVGTSAQSCLLKKKNIALSICILTSPREAKLLGNRDLGATDQSVGVFDDTLAYWQFIKLGYTGFSASRLLCSVARCCGRGTSSTGFDQLKSMLDCIQKVSDKTPAVEQFSQQIIIDTAYTFAEQLPDVRYLAFAAELEGNVRGHIVPRLSPSMHGKHREESAAGFRWEEGISEWVAATPTSNKPAPSRDRAPRVVYNDRPRCGSPEELRSPVKQQPEVSTPDFSCKFLSSKFRPTRKCGTTLRPRFSQLSDMVMTPPKSETKAGQEPRGRKRKVEKARGKNIEKPRVTVYEDEDLHRTPQLETRYSSEAVSLWYEGQEGSPLSVCLKPVRQKASDVAFEQDDLDELGIASASKVRCPASIKRMQDRAHWSVCGQTIRGRASDRLSASHRVFLDDDSGDELSLH